MLYFNLFLESNFENSSSIRDFLKPSNTVLKTLKCLKPPGPLKLYSSLRASGPSLNCGVGPWFRNLVLIKLYFFR